MGTRRRKRTRGSIGLLVGGLAVAALAGAPAAQAAVTIDGNSASIDTFQALNASDEHSEDKFGDDFLIFAENLIPPDLTGPEGLAHAFVSQASSVITPQSIFPITVTDGFATSGRLLDRATKSTNPAPGVPVASSEGSFEIDFETTGVTPLQFAGALQTLNTDENDCTEITVELSGPLSRTFEASAGGDCPSSHPDSTGFVVTNPLPAGSYILEVDYDATVDPEDPGTRRAQGAVETSVTFFPPNTRLTRARILRQRRKATFRFKKVGKGKGFQCRLLRRGRKRKPPFRRCTSPKVFRNLRPGRYTFEVRVIGPVAPDATPARFSFRIPK